MHQADTKLKALNVGYNQTILNRTQTRTMLIQEHCSPGTYDTLLILKSSSRKLTDVPRYILPQYCNLVNF